MVRTLKGAWYMASAGLSWLILTHVAYGKFQDPLDTPAALRTRAAERPLMAVTLAGTRLIAVGSRGLIILSDDHGRSWAQAKVPVQSDLLAVHFPAARDGWVVGHDGVVLHTTDGGASWEKQFDGRVAGDAFTQYYLQAIRSREDAAAIQVAAKQIEQNYKAGASLPLLDVWFEDTQNGFAVGPFGMIIATGDGGKTWEPWLHRIDNSQGLNLNAIRGIGREVFIAGEHGAVYRLDRKRTRFIRTDTGYLGSFFGIAGNEESLVAFGLRGVAYRSADGGVNWEPLSMPSEQTINAGLAREGDGFVLANAAGRLLVGDASGRTFHLSPAAGNTMVMTGICALQNGTYVVTGLEGVRTEVLNESSASAR